MQRTLRRAFMLSVAGAVLSACTDSPDSSPTAPMVTRPNLAVYPTVCDINALKTFGRGYAFSNQDDLVQIVIPALQTALRVNNPATPAGKAAINNAAFDGLAELAEMRGTARQKTTEGVRTAFDGLVRGFVGCLDAATRESAAEENWGNALSAGWTFEVRGGANDLSEGAYERGSGTPYWAAEAPGGWSASSGGTRFLIYGYRIAAYPNQPADDKIGHAYETRTIPSVESGLLSFSPAIHIGLCKFFAETEEALATYRVAHKDDVLPKRNISCADPAGFTPVTVTSSLGTLNPVFLAKRVVSYLAPQPLHAATFLALGSVGGAVSELSPSVVIDMEQVTSAFVNPEPDNNPTSFLPLTIADGRVSRQLTGTDGGPVYVRVTTLAGTPLEGATVTLAIFGNSSVIAFFNEGDGITVSRTTDENGLASFAGVRLLKAGGYTLVATPSFDEIPGAPILSNPFTIQNR